MFGSLGGPEIIAIFVLALLLFGPRRLPQIGRTIGRTMTEFRKATHDFKSSLEREIELEEVKEARDTLKETVRDANQAVRQLNDDTDLTATGPRRTPASTPEARVEPKSADLPASRSTDDGSGRSS